MKNEHGNESIKIYNRYNISFIQQRQYDEEEQKMAIAANRYNSFVNIQTSPLRRRQQHIIDKFVQAGLYYYKPKSSYKCFSCKLTMFTTLINVNDDNPMIEHIRVLFERNQQQQQQQRFLTCDFIQRLVASQYVRAVHDLFYRFGSKHKCNSSDVLQMMRVNLADHMPHLIEYPFERTNAYLALQQTGAFEPAELQRSALNIIHNNNFTVFALLRQLFDDDDDDDDNYDDYDHDYKIDRQHATCLLCCEKPAVIVNVPCGHCFACSECSLITNAKKPIKCATCRAKVSGNIQIAPNVERMQIDNGRIE